MKEAVLLTQVPPSLGAGHLGRLGRQWLPLGSLRVTGHGAR